MLFSRAMSNGFRWHCPDLFTGAAVYTPDELDFATDEEGNVTPPVSTQATVIEPQPTTNGNGNGNPHNERVRGVRKLLGIDSKTVLEWLKTEKLVSSPAELEAAQVDELVQWIGVQWAINQGVHHVHATHHS